MTKEKWENLLESGLSLDHHFLLMLIKEGESLPSHPRIQGLINLLSLKGYLQEGTLTEKGEELIRGDGIKKEEKSDFPSILLNSLRRKLKELTGKEQKLGFGNTYFIPSYKDLENCLNRWNREYKMLRGNEEKIEKILLAHAEKCHTENSWSPAIQYFIIKERPLNSRLAAVLENYEEPQESEKYISNIG